MRITGGGFPSAEAREPVQSGAEVLVSQRIPPQDSGILRRAENLAFSNFQHRNSQVGYVLNLSFWALDTELLKMTPSGEKGAVGFHIRRLHRNPLFSTIRFLSLLNSLSNLPPSLRGKEAKMKTLPISRFLAFFTVRLASADPGHLLDASIPCPVWRFWPLNETFRRPIPMG